MRVVVFILLVFIPLWGQAQFQSVEYDVVKHQINAGRALPSEEAFYVRGILPDDVDMVELTIFKSNKNKSSGRVYSWRAPYQFPTNSYEIFVADPLRSNYSYSLHFSFFKKADMDEMDALKNAIHQNLEAYIRANYQVRRRNITSLVSDKVFINHLNQIVIQGIDNYAHLLGQDFRGFSDLVRQKVDQTRKMSLRNARFNIVNRRENQNERAVYADQLINELVDLTKAETSQFLRSNMLMLVDVRHVESYPTEKKPFYLPLNVGYAGTYFSGDFNNLNYGTAPFVGLSVPLGNRKFTKILGNASFSTGVMLTNMENNQGQEISGPLIGRPIYAGLGYTIFRVLRFNAGAALTSSELNGNAEDVTIYPFLGFSLEFNLWLGFGAKR
jgi:hypothetical protein